MGGGVRKKRGWWLGVGRVWPAVSKVPREAHFVIPVAQVVFSGVGFVRRPSLRTGCPSPASQRREGSPPFPREPCSWSARAPRERRGPHPSPPGKGELECRVRPGKDSLFHTVETSMPHRQRSPAKVLSDLRLAGGGFPAAALGPESQPAWDAREGPAVGRERLGDAPLVARVWQGRRPPQEAYWLRGWPRGSACVGSEDGDEGGGGPGTGAQGERRRAAGAHCLSESLRFTDMHRHCFTFWIFLSRKGGSRPGHSSSTRTEVTRWGLQKAHDWKDSSSLRTWRGM